MKVFRKFRWKGLQDGKVRNYILYAIGEILLVVVGILIALSINNWNNEKELRKAEKQIYRNILKKITADKNDVEDNVDYNNYFMVRYQLADEIIVENDRNRMDELSVLLLELYKYSDLDVSENIYQNLVNSGDLKLLKNDSIIWNMQQLEELYKYCNRMENIHWEVIMKNVGPGLMDNIHILDRQVERPDELYSFKTRNLIYAMTSIMKEKDTVYNLTVEQIDKIGGLIDSELSHN